MLGARQDSVERLPELVRQLYSVVAELESIFHGRKFTPDGHLVGSLGEVLAAYHYGLELLPSSTAGHDAKSGDGRLVQIKATQRDSVALRATCDCLLVLKLDEAGGFAEIYNGPGQPVWDMAGGMGKNGQRAVSIAKLRVLARSVAASDRLRRVR